MEILPAIDLKDGKAVRLNKGVMSSAKIYSHNPLELAKKFEDLGAKWLHLVDLDGAFAGQAVNFELIEKIITSTKLKVEIGGGIRDENRIKNYVNLGANRLILGSVALTNIEFVKQMAKKYKIVVGIDAIKGNVATHGWAQITQIKATDLAKLYANAGVEAMIVTDISKDGMLSGVNIEFTAKIALESGIKTIASGGVKDLQDIINLKQNGKISGVIVGKAYYEGKLDLKKAFEIIL